MHENCIVICKMNKPSDHYPVPRFRQKFEIPGCSYSILQTQFPLQLAYAVTVHRMQGMTVQRTVVKLNDRFFASCQAYVALSRVKHLKDLVLWDYCQSSIHILKFYKGLLEWCDCVDVIRPTPPTKMVPHPECADDVSDAPLHVDTYEATPLQTIALKTSNPQQVHRSCVSSGGAPTPLAHRCS